jgi:citrate lyase gamma subunit|tara:strand:+ start:70 stop:591 length:522 start_codon:yes stop_codon:yes gene_type:complete
MSGYVNARVDIEIDGNDIMQGIVDNIGDVARQVMQDDLDIDDQVVGIINSFDFSDIVLSEVVSYDYGEQIEDWLIDQLESMPIEQAELCRLGKAFKSAVNTIVDQRIEARRKTGVDELASLQDSHANLQRQVMALTKGMNAMHTFLSSSNAASNTAISAWKGAQANIMGYHSD